MEICGIDEAGRGPIAGPLVIAGCILLKDIEGFIGEIKVFRGETEGLLERFRAEK